MKKEDRKRVETLPFWTTGILHLWTSCAAFLPHKCLAAHKIYGNLHIMYLPFLLFIHSQ